MPRKPNPELRRWWRELIQSYDSERLTVAEFCQEQGISTASFYQWRRKLSGEHSPAIIPVELVESSGRSDAEHCAIVRIGSRAEIQISAGHEDLATQIALALATAGPEENNRQEEVLR